MHNHPKHPFICRILEILDSSVVPTSKTLFDAAVGKLAHSMESYKDNEDAGKCLIWYVSQRAGTFHSYLDHHKHMFNIRTWTFMDLHREELAAFAEENEHLNYHNVDMFSAATFINNYLLRLSIDENSYESPIYMYIRIASQLYSPQNSTSATPTAETDALTVVKRTVIEMATKMYVQSSPTLFNSGLKKHQLSSCFLIQIDDNLEDILGTGIKEAGIVSSSGGGIGINLSSIRHSEIGFQGESNGVVPYGHVVDSLIEYANQSGKRKGAATAFLDIWHIDVVPFINATNKVKTTAKDLYRTLKISLWTRDLFFKRVKKGQKWTMFCPAKAKQLLFLYGEEFEKAYINTERDAFAQDAEAKFLLEVAKLTGKASDRIAYIDARRKAIKYEQIDADELMTLIISNQINTGGPYLCHGDAINAKSNHKNIGSINSSNLCLEIMEATPIIDGERSIASCNLASLNLSAYADAEKHTYDYTLLGDMTAACVRNLNAVIDSSYYPLGPKGKIAKLNNSSRPIGIGVSGLSDAFAIMDIIPESNEMYDINHRIFACIYFNALCESINMAITDGKYEYFEGSPISAGQLQFDMWGVKPLAPSEWSQKSVTLSDGFIIEPTWEGVKGAIRRYGIRNSLLVALMPTASSSQSIRNAETTEYHQSNIYSRNVQGGRFTICNRWMIKDLEKHGLWSNDLAEFIILCQGSVKHIDKWFLATNTSTPADVISHIQSKYRTQFEISQKSFIRMERDRGAYVDQSQSFNIYLKDPTINTLKAIHLYSHSIGNKVGMYYLRTAPPSMSAEYGISERVKGIYNNIMDQMGYDRSMSGNVREIPSAPIAVDSGESGCSMCE